VDRARHSVRRRRTRNPHLADVGESDAIGPVELQFDAVEIVELRADSQLIRRDGTGIERRRDSGLAKSELERRELSGGGESVQRYGDRERAHTGEYTEVKWRALKPDASGDAYNVRMRIAAAAAAL